MAGEPIELAKSFITAFTSRLRREDRISLISFSRYAEVLIDNLPAGPAAAKQIDRVLGNIEVSNITHLESGILLAYTMAEKTYSPEKLNRVLVISDGGANAGTTTAEIIGKYAEDSERQGIYLAGIGMGEGFNDSMMNTLTDMGRGAYLFLDSPDEIDNVLSEKNFPAHFDLAVKDVRLKLQMPPGWKIEQFHGEQMSTKASEVLPQYLAPKDQMIYHMELGCEKGPEEIGSDTFTFEAEYTPIGGRPAKLAVSAAVSEMTAANGEIQKGDAVTAYAEMLKSIKLPLEENTELNTSALDTCLETVENAAAETGDKELEEIAKLLGTYRLTLQFGEQLGNTRDKNSQDPAAALNISPNDLIDIEISGGAPESAVQVLSRLNRSTRLLPQEGYRFLALSSGPVGNPNPAGSGELTGRNYPDPAPRFMGRIRTSGSSQAVFDLHAAAFTLQAPIWAESFSFDFNFFSAEYPDYVQQSFNDTFYAVIEAHSTNQGAPTNIAFDANNHSIEVDNNYFQNPFHPIPNTGTGFDLHGSTGWLRTSWPIRGGETFTLTFSVHDEGDAIYDSLVILDNFAFHDYPAAGTTDPLN